MSKGFGFRQFADVMLVRFGHGPPDDDDWRVLMTAWTSGQVTRVLLWSDGGSLDIARRKEAAEVIAAHQLKVAVVAKSRLARGAALALGWKTDAADGFLPNRLEKALEFLDIAEDTIGEIRRAFADLVDRRAVTGGQTAAQ